MSSINNTFFIFSLISIIWLCGIEASPKKVVCYYGSWTTYRGGNGKVTIEDLNPNLCTHLIYSFVGLTDDGCVKILDTWNDIDKNGLNRFVSLKNKNPNLKVLAAIGGWNEGSEKYSKVINSEPLRKKFISSIVSFVLKYKFDGFDLDWEYPGQRGGSSTDRKAFAEFLKELRCQFDINSEDLLITAAVGAAEHLQTTSYDIPMLNKYLDFINLMTYDYHGSWDPVTGQNSPLYPIGNAQLSVDSTIRSWIKAGASPQKLILGVAVYGRTFTLSTSKTDLSSSVSGPGAKGKYSAENGMLTYLEICENLNEGGWTTVWDEVQKVPYSYKNNQWIGYDDLKSVELKAKYAVDNSLGGVMIWSIDSDDIKNVCGHGNYPILSKIKNTLHKNETEAIEDKCKKDFEFLPDANNCKSFYICMQTGTKFSVIKKECSGDMLFDKVYLFCSSPLNARC